MFCIQGLTFVGLIVPVIFYLIFRIIDLNAAFAISYTASGSKFGTSTFFWTYLFIDLLCRLLVLTLK